MTYTHGRYRDTARALGDRFPVTTEVALSGLLSDKYSTREDLKTVGYSDAVKDADYELLPTDETIFFSITANRTVTLPDHEGLAHRNYTIVRIDNNSAFTLNVVPDVSTSIVGGSYDIEVQSTSIIRPNEVIPGWYVVSDSQDLVIDPDTLIAAKIKIIKTQSDFPDPIVAPDGVTRIPLEEGVEYIIDVTQLVLTVPFLLETTSSSIPAITKLNGETFRSILYVGSATFLYGRSISSFRCEDIVFISALGARFIDVTGNLGHIGFVQFEEVQIIGFTRLGRISTNSIIDFISVSLINYSFPCEIHNIVAMNMSRLNLITFVPVGNTVFVFTGDMGFIFSDKVLLDFLPSGESAFALDSNANLNVTAFTQNSYLGLPAYFFQPDLTGAIIEFADSAIDPGVKTTVTTSAFNVLTDDRSTVLSGTTNYNGLFTVSSTDYANKKFDIDTPFVSNDATGTYLTKSVDEKSKFIDAKNNGALPDSQISCNMIMGSVVRVQASQNVPEIVNDATTGDTNIWSDNISERFIISPSLGRATFDGARPTHLKVECVSSIERQGGGSDLISGFLSVNGVILPESESFSEDNKASVIDCVALVTLSPGDYVEFWVMNNDSNRDIDVYRANMIITGG